MASQLPPPGDSLNPFQPVPSEPKPQVDGSAVVPRKGSRRIEYLTSFRFVFTNPEWFKNLLIGAVCMLIPVLNQLLIFGYTYEIVELLHRRSGGSYPSFDFKRFGIYIQRGVWPFIIAFIAQTIMQPVMQISIQGTMFGVMAIVEADEQTGAIVAAIVVPLVVIGLFVFVIAMILFLTPLLLRAGLSQDFVKAFNFKWILDFIKRMWLETILVNVFVILSTMVLMPIGCVFFCYGFFVAAFFMGIVGAHLGWQLYELYLERGGEPIPLKPLPADVPPVVVPPSA